MKKLTRFYLAFVMGLLIIISCKKEKKEEPQPAPSTSLATSLAGVWTVYGSQYYNAGIWNGSTSTTNYRIKFTSTQYSEDFDNNGIYEYVFDATYNGSTVSFSGYDNTNTMRYGAFEASASGNEYRLKASNNSNHHNYLATNSPDYIVYLIKK